jgi:UDP-N-acetylmuramoyl-L-alanyl-D-glutamate--2,6-diaminopimelate ligase
MTLRELVGAARTLGSHPDVAAVPVTGVTHDSRAVAAGSVFVAVPGLKTDGAKFAADAQQRGAAAVVAETPKPEGVSVPWLTTGDARLSLSELAAIFYGDPSRALTVVGMTGTNGKTTSTYLMASVFDAANMPCGRMSTTTIRVAAGAGGERDAAHTTPEASDVQRLLREMRTAGCRACAMEVSSHALVLHRVAHVSFSAAIFTNLTRDHLDFHRDMQQYFAAKRKLFEMLPAGAPSAINIDDPRGAELAAGRAGVLTYSLDRAADVRARGVQSTLEGLAFEADTPRGPVAIRSPLVGRPTSTTSSASSPPPRGSACPCRRSRPASRGSSACPAGSRWCPAAPTTCASSWTTRTPTTRSRTCSKRRVRSRRAASSPSSAAAAIAIARSGR